MSEELLPWDEFLNDEGIETMWGDFEHAMSMGLSPWSAFIETAEARIKVLKDRAKPVKTQEE